ncbi:MAG: hypothetical protein HC903_14250 [Methylacidiphilales bacterium]|nr:hypothetical protein [Candidatus Methylacidiphilales bacterium]
MTSGSWLRSAIASSTVATSRGTIILLWGHWGLGIGDWALGNWGLGIGDW